MAENNDVPLQVMEGIEKLRNYLLHMIGNKFFDLCSINFC